MGFFKNLEFCSGLLINQLMHHGRMVAVRLRLLLLSVGNNILSFGDLQSVLFEISNLMNERPIGMKPGNDTTLGSNLCPNDLLLERASSKAPCGPWDDVSNDMKRMKFIQHIASSFWRRWQSDYFPTLIIRQRWHVDRRNLIPGDIVLVQDSNSVLGHWKMAEIIKAHPGQDGKVGNVTLRYKLKKPYYYTVISRGLFSNRSAHLPCHAVNSRETKFL